MNDVSTTTTGGASPASKDRTAARFKFLLVVLTLVAALVAGIAAGDAATAQESSEAALEMASAYTGYGWSWR